MSMRQFISPLVGEMVGRPEGVRATHEALKKTPRTGCEALTISVAVSVSW